MLMMKYMSKIYVKKLQKPISFFFKKTFFIIPELKLNTKKNLLPI